MAANMGFVSCGGAFEVGVVRVQVYIIIIPSPRDLCSLETQSRAGVVTTKQ